MRFDLEIIGDGWKRHLSLKTTVALNKLRESLAELPNCRQAGSVKPSLAHVSGSALCAMARKFDDFSAMAMFNRLPPGSRRHSLPLENGEPSTAPSTTFSRGRMP